MKNIALVFLGTPNAEVPPGADIVLAWDREADRLGAPQNVASLLSLIHSGKSVWYRGGMETVHTAELILGLGCEKVLVAHGFFKTERMPQHFVNRIGKACVPVAASQSELDIALAAGASFVICEFPIQPARMECIAKIPEMPGAVFERTCQDA